jgi:hypothetical protein
MDKCPKCGNKLSGIDVLCPRCGALVEIIQIRKPSGAQSASSDAPVKKLPQQNLIVYNDDWPANDMDLSDAPGMAYVDPGGFPAESPAAAESPDIKAELEPSDSLVPDYFSSESDIGSEEDYLAMLKSMNLPELESLDDVTPQTQDEPVSRRWLEIEELEDTKAVSSSEANELKPAAHDIKPEAYDTESVAYESKKEAYAPVSRTDALPDDVQRRYRYQPERKRAQASAPRRGAGRVVLTVFIWLVVASALFCGFFFLNQYVTNRYGSYQSMLYELSGGNIDLETSAEARPSPNEAPSLR